MTVTLQPDPDNQKPVKADEVFRLHFSDRADAPSVASAFGFRMVQDEEGNPVDSPVPGTLAANPSGRIFTFTPASPLEEGSRYELRLTTAARDDAGNPLAGEVVASYRTAPGPGEPDVILHASGVRVMVPPGALPPGAYVAVSTAPLSTAEAATLKLIESTGDSRRLPAGPAVAVLEAFLDDDVPATGMLPVPVTVSLPTRDDDGDGLVDGLATEVRVETLSVYWLDVARSAWVRLPSSRVDAAAGLVSAETPRLTLFAAIGQSRTDLSRAHAFPVPVSLGAGPGSVTFTQLGDLTRIRVFTVGGERVADLQETDGDGVLGWDLRNGEGQTVVPGVYTFVLTSGDEVKRGKLVVLP